MLNDGGHIAAGDLFCRLDLFQLAGLDLSLLLI
jgi:hypothetical protein